jgi:hypothetical protein
MNVNHLIFAAIVVGVVLQRGIASAQVTIDFQAFSPGASLATVNLVTEPMGATFDSLHPASVQADLQDASNMVLGAPTDPLGADILINFSEPVDHIAVKFMDLPFTTFGSVSLKMYDHNGTPETIQNSEPIHTYELDEPSTYSFWGPPVIRAVQLDAEDVNWPDVIVDDFGFNPVPSLPPGVPAASAYWNAFLAATLLATTALYTRRIRGRSS